MEVKDGNKINTTAEEKKSRVRNNQKRCKEKL